MKGTYQEAVVLAGERGYYDPVMRNGHLIVYWRGEAVDWVYEILMPRGLASYHQTCENWDEACRLLGMLPPGRGGNMSIGY